MYFPQNCELKSLNEFSCLAQDLILWQSERSFQKFHWAYWKKNILFLLQKKKMHENEQHVYPQNYFHATAQAMNYTLVYLKLDRFIEICMSLYACNRRSSVSFGLVLDCVRHVVSYCRVDRLQYLAVSNFCEFFKMQFY